MGEPNNGATISATSLTTKTKDPTADASLIGRLVQLLRGNERGGWQITFTAFILILLAFFIMLSSFATIEQAKVTSFVRSFSTAVNILTGGLKFGKNKDILPVSADVIKDFDILPTLEGVAKGLELSEGIEIEVTPRGLVMRLSDRLLFASGVAELSPFAYPLLNHVADIILKTEYPVHIEGHTDNIPIHTPRYPSNWELSTARAVNVLRYFIKQGGIDSGRLTAVGFSEFHPLVPNDTGENRAVNRRVEIVFVGSPEDFLPEGVGNAH